jgi:hypothetical protein
MEQFVAGGSPTSKARQGEDLSRQRFLELGRITAIELIAVRDTALDDSLAMRGLPGDPARYKVKVLPGRYWEERTAREQICYFLKKKSCKPGNERPQGIVRRSRGNEIERRVVRETSDGEKRSDAAIQENVL